MSSHVRRAVQIRGPLGGILPAKLLGTAFDFGELPAVGCMVGHGGILAFDDQTDMREVARHPLRSARSAAGPPLPCRAC
jgi:formate dehydrogenase iron-sulfur subunit